MKIEWNAKTRLPEIKLEEKDFLDAAHIQDMVTGKFLCTKCGNQAENNGWKVLLGYLESQRLLLEKKIHTSIDTNVDEGRTRIQVAKLVGFDHFMTLPERVINQANELREKLSEKGEDNGRDDEY